MDEKKKPNSIWAWLMDAPVKEGEGAALPTPPAAAVPARQYEIDGKDRVLLPIAWLLGLLFVELAQSVFLDAPPGLMVTVLVVAWYAALLWYKGSKGLGERTNLLLLIAVGLLALTFALFSNSWLRLWNLLLLPPLMAVQFFQWSGAARKPWSIPTMLWERLCLTMDGLFRRLGIPFKAMAPKGGGRAGYVVLGLVAAVPVLLFVFPLLISADALFQSFTSGIVAFITENLSEWMIKLLVALCVAPFLFGLLYALRRPEPLKEKSARVPLAVDATLPVTLLFVVDLLYLVFLAVQFAGLFGGDKYLALTGISYADYARSGFFQLVTVSVFNLALVMTCLQVAKKEGRGWQGVRLLTTILVGASAILLLSAAWKMTLYVMVYGLSFKRFLTYWGMVMLAIFFAAALLKIWKKKFSFFKVFLTAGIAGWLLLNYMNADVIVAKYNVSLYQRGGSAVMDLPYLADLSYDTLDVLEELPQDTAPWHNDPEFPLSRLITQRRMAAAQDAAHWRTWSLSAQCAALAIDSRLPRDLNLNLSAGTVQAAYDSHGGFHGDGRRYLELAFDAAAGETLAQTMEVRADWLPLPLTENLKEAAERALPTEEEAFAGAENGYYYFIDRNSKSTDPTSDEGLLERHSFNFTLAVYDQETGVLYYLALDT